MWINLTLICLSLAAFFFGFAVGWARGTRPDGNSDDGGPLWERQLAFKRAYRDTQYVSLN